MDQKEIMLAPETSMAKPTEKNQCELHPERLSLALTDKATSAFAWAASICVFFVSAAAILVAFFRSREKS